MTSRTSLRASPQAGEAISYTYGEGSAGPHAVTSSLRAEGEAISISYDANGNMTSKTVIASPQGEAISAYSYDIENRLTEVATPKEEYISNYQIPLQTGYNFVSIPLVVTDNIETILRNSGITDAEISRLNAQTGEWEFFIFDNAQVFGTPDFVNFDYGRGYEIYLETNCTLTFSGVTPLTDKTLELYSGDNLIAAPTTTSVSVEEALAGITYISVKAASSLRGVQDPEAISYVDVTELQAGYSYFINVATQKTWNIPREKDKTTYVYDGDGGRVMSLRTPKLRGEAISTTYIGSSYETSLRAGGEAISKKHIFMGSTRVCTVETVGTTTDYFYFHQDHIGSSNVVTDETGQLAKLIEYSPYGLTAREEGSYNTDYKFTGKLFDTSTGLYYYGARYYDPELGRFIQPDTIVPYPSDPQSFNRYSYARNNPIRYIDPSGHSWLSKLAGLFFAIGTYFGVGGPSNPSAFAIAAAVFNAVDAGISAYQAGANGLQAAGISAAAAIASAAGAHFGGQFGDWVGGGQFGATVFSFMFANAAGAATRSALTGGNIFVATVVGAGQGAAAGIMLGGLSYTAPQPTPNQSPNEPTENPEVKEAIKKGDIGRANDAGRSGSNGPPDLGAKTAVDELAGAAKRGEVGSSSNHSSWRERYTEYLDKYNIEHFKQYNENQASMFGWLQDKTAETINMLQATGNQYIAAKKLTEATTAYGLGSFANTINYLLWTVVDVAHAAFSATAENIQMKNR